MKSTKSAYLVLALGVFILTLSPILGASLSVKLADINGLHQTNKITATKLSNAKQSRSFSLENVKQLAQYGLRDYDLAYALEASTLAAYQKNQSRARVLGVNDRYHQFHQISLKAGGFFTSGHENQQVAIIDEDLAQALFQNGNVVGLEIELYGRKFKIIGVAGKDRSLIGTLTDKGFGTAYIPVKQLLELEANSQITSLEVETRDTGTTGRNTANIKTALASIGQDPANYKIIDYNMERLLLEQKHRLRNFVVGAVALVLLFGLLRRKIRAIDRFLRARLQEKYFSEIIRGDAARLMLGIAEILVLVAVMLLLWKLIRFPLYISPENIPNELIDLSFFTDLLKSGIQASIQGTGYLAAPGEDQLNMLNAIQNWNVFLAIFLGLPLFYLGLHRVMALEGELLKVAVFCSACLLVALLAGHALLLMTKMPLAMGAKDVLPVFICIFFSVISFEVRREADGQVTFKEAV